MLISLPFTALFDCAHGYPPVYTLWHPLYRALAIIVSCRPAVDKLEWQLPLEIVKYPDPRLRAPNAKIGVFDDKLKDLAKHMFEVMYQ